MRPGHLTQAKTTLTALTLSIASAIATANRQADAGHFDEALQTLLDYDLHFSQSLQQIEESHKSAHRDKFKKDFDALDALKINIQSLYKEMGHSIRRYTTTINPDNLPPRELAVAMPPPIIPPPILPQAHEQAPPPQEVIDPKRLVLSLNVDEIHARGYAAAYLNLTSLKFTNIAPATKSSLAVKRHLDALLRYIEKLNDSGKEFTSTLTMVLEDTVALLRGEPTMTPKEYHKKANNIQGKPSLALNILGGLMLALGVAAMAAAIALAAIGLGMVLITTSAATSAAALTVGGLSFFAGRREGLSESMLTVVNDEVSHRKLVGAGG